MRRIFVCCLVLAFSLPLLAMKIRSIEQLGVDQRQVVSAYCRLDFGGARLSPEGWARMRTLATFRENPDFNAIFIVSRYQLIETHTRTHSLDVAYTVIGRYEVGAGYMPMPSVRNATFETRDQEGELRIANIDPATPFVSRKAAIDWLKTKLTGQNDAHAQAQIQSAIQTLEAQEASTTPSK